jgi:PAS domain S-box-containing protein
MSRKNLSLIEESNLRYFALFEQSPLGILIIDPETYLPIEFNSAAHKQLGYSRAEFEQLRVQEYDVKDTSEKIARRFASVLKNGLESYETIHRTKLGESRYIQVSIQPLIDANHKYVHCIYEDITDRHKAEEINNAKSELLKSCNLANARPELLQNLISFFKTFSGCEAVGIRLHNNEDYPYIGTTGFPEAHIKMENTLCSLDDTGEILRNPKGKPVLECMCGNIIHAHFDPKEPFYTKHGSFWTGNTTQLLADSKETDRPIWTRNRCIGEGFESVALIPIRLKDKTLGLFQFNDKRVGWLTAEKIVTLEHLVDYVAIPLAKLEAEDALAVSEQSFKEIFNSTTEAIFIHDADTGQVLDVNETMLKIYGFSSKEEAITKNRFELASDESLFSGEKALKLIHKAVSEGPQVFEWLAKRSDGSLFWSEVALNTAVIGGKKRVLAVVRDISERKRMEEALNDSMERYRLIFEEMTEGFALHEVIQDANGKPIDYRFIDVNPAFERQTGLKRETLIGHTVKEVMPETENYWIEKYGDVALHGGNLHYENFSGVLGKWFNVIAFCPKYGQFAVTFEDITDRKANELALFESEEQFRSIFEQAAIGMTMVSPEGIFLRVNKAFCQMCGYSSEEMIGNSISLVTHPDDMQISEKKLQQSISEADQNVQFEKRYVQKNGQIVWVSISSSLIQDGKGNPKYFITQVQDITQRRTAQEALHLRDKIFTHSLDMLFVAGDDGFFKVLNPAWEKNLGWSMEELTSKPWLEFVYPDDRDMTYSVKIQKLDNGYEAVQFENRYLCKDGSIKWLSWNSFPYPEEKIIIGVARDITENRKLNESLRQSEEKYQFIDEASNDLIYSYDLHGRFTHANSTLCKYLGLNLNQIIGKTHAELGFPQNQCDEWDRLHKKVYETDTTVISETVTPIQGKDSQFFEVVLNPIHNEDGEIIGIAGTTRNINVRKQAEIKIQEQLDELRRWNAVTLGRESRILELKQEVNQLLIQQKQPPKYESGNNMESTYV